MSQGCETEVPGCEGVGSSLHITICAHPYWRIDLIAEAVLRRRPELLFELTVCGDGRMAVTVAGKSIEFPGDARAVLARALNGEPFTADELPGSFDEAGRHVLLRRLLREGVIEVVRRA